MAATTKKNGRSGTPVPLNLSDELAREVKAISSEGGISEQDVMRQALKRGLPKVRAFFCKPKAA